MVWSSRQLEGPWFNYLSLLLSCRLFLSQFPFIQVNKGTLRNYDGNINENVTWKFQFTFFELLFKSFPLDQLVQCMLQKPTHQEGGGGGGGKGELGWRSGESTCLPPVWPGFDSRTWRLKCCWFSSLLAPLLKNQHFKFQFDLDYCQALYYEPLVREIVQALPVLLTLNNWLYFYDQPDSISSSEWTET